MLQKKIIKGVFLMYPRHLSTWAGALSRIISILQCEGPLGLYDRIRYPKSFTRRPSAVMPLQGNVRLYGENIEERQGIKNALNTIGIAVVDDNDQEFETTIFIGSSLPDIAQVTSSDIVVFISPLDTSDIIMYARRCRAILIPSLDIISDLVKHNIPFEKLFFLRDEERFTESIVRCILAFQKGSNRSIDWRVFKNLRGLSVRPRVCIGLPETVERRRSFLSRKLSNFIIFDGIKKNPGWIGAGESFRLLAQSCLDQGVEQALFVEDDVQILPEFKERFDCILNYLDGCSWDIFSGMITDVGKNYNIHKVVRYRGQTFVHLNRCVGMVFGIYRNNALYRLSEWDASTGLTIDRFLEDADNLNIVTTLPFLVGHDSELTSSIWRFSNRRYNRLIHSSEEKLRIMVQDHEKSQPM